MNPLDISALDASTLNLSLNMTTAGKKGSTEGTPLPVMLQPTSTVTVSLYFLVYDKILTVLGP